MRGLVPCPSCACHVRVSEAECPHCGAALPREGVLPSTTAAVLLGLGATLTFSVAACGSTEKRSNAGFGGSTSASFSSSYMTIAAYATSPTSSTTSPTSSNSGSGSACYDESGILAFKTPPTTVVKQMVCTPTQFNDYLKNCVLMGATQAACDMFTMDMANKPCVACMTGDDMSTSPPALVIFPTLDMKALIYGNRVACQALVEGKPQCGGPLTTADLCDQSACQGCMDNTSFQECVKAAEAGACKETIDKISAECRMVGKNGFDPKCDGKDFQTIAQAVVTQICGK
jgi:hypothetical protein